MAAAMVSDQRDRLVRFSGDSLHIAGASSSSEGQRVGDGEIHEHAYTHHGAAQQRQERRERERFELEMLGLREDRESEEDDPQREEPGDGDDERVDPSLETLVYDHLQDSPAEPEEVRGEHGGEDPVEDRAHQRVSAESEPVGGLHGRSREGERDSEPAIVLAQSGSDDGDEAELESEQRERIEDDPSGGFPVPSPAQNPAGIHALERGAQEKNEGEKQARLCEPEARDDVALASGLLPFEAVGEEPALASEPGEPGDLAEAPPEGEEDERDADDPRPAKVAELGEIVVATCAILEVERVRDAEESEESEESDQTYRQHTECIGSKSRQGHYPKNRFHACSLPASIKILPQ